MDYLPIFVDLRGRTCLLVGGGDVALRKAEQLTAAHAALRVVAPRIRDGLRVLARSVHAVVIERGYQPSDLDGVQLVVAATDDHALNARVAADAHARALFVNVVDSPALCSFIMPAIVDRSPVIAAISTGGASPVLARRTRAQVEAVLPDRLGELAAFAASERAVVRSAIEDPQLRREFWERLFDSEIAERVLAGETAEARVAFARALAEPSTLPDAKRVALIACDDGDADRLSWAAVRWLANTDAVVHTRALSIPLRSVIRRDAERVQLDANASSVAQLVSTLRTLLANDRRISVLALGGAADLERIRGALAAERIDAVVFSPVAP